MRLGLILALLLAWHGVAAAADDAEEQVRQELERELERELQGMVKSSPPPALEIFFDSTLDPKYELLEASFTLDGNPLAYKVPSPGRQSLFFGILGQGQHVVTAQLVYREKPTSAFFNYTTLKYRLPGRYVFGAQRGLHMRMQMKVEANDALDAAKRLSLQAALEADMMVDASDQLQSDKRPAVVEVENPPKGAGTEGTTPKSVPAVTPATGAAQAAVETKTTPAAGKPDPAPVTPIASPASGTPGPVAVQATTSAVGGTSPATATRIEPGPSPDSASPSATPDKPKRKRIRRHMKNLLQNLAKSAKEDDDAADDVRLKSLQKNLARSLKQGSGAGEWQEVRDEVVEEPDPSPAKPNKGVSAPANPEKAAGNAGPKPKAGKGGAGSKKKPPAKTARGGSK